MRPRVQLRGLPGGGRRDERDDPLVGEAGRKRGDVALPAEESGRIGLGEARKAGQGQESRPARSANRPPVFEDTIEDAGGVRLEGFVSVLQFAEIAPWSTRSAPPALASANPPGPTFRPD
jgi:hypothetical protein